MFRFGRADALPLENGDLPVDKVLFVAHCFISKSYLNGGMSFSQLNNLLKVGFKLPCQEILVDETVGSTIIWIIAFSIFNIL